MIEAAAEKHVKFAEQLEERDAEIFIMIPALLILKNIENDDKQIGSIFYPDLENPDSEQGRQASILRALYESLIHKKGKYELYNLIEKCLLSVPLTTTDKATLAKYDIEATLTKPILGLAMQLSRFKPADWNKFLDVVIKWFYLI